MNPLAVLWSRKKILRKGRLAGCMVLIALVAAPLVIALVFSDSMMSGITNKYIYLSDGHIKTEGIWENTASDPAFLYADTVTEGYALMYSSTATASVTLKGVSETYFNELRSSQITFIREPELEPSNLNGITLSRSVAEKLGVSIGDRVALMVVPDSPSRVLRPVVLRVEAVFYTGYDQLDSGLCFISLDYAGKLFQDPSSTSTEILVSNEYNERLQEAIEKLGVSGKVTTWNQHNVSVYRNFVTSRQMIMIILLIVVFVAAFYTASVAQQMVQDDMREIAVLKLTGASDRLVRQAAFMSVYGVTAAGILLGLGLGLLVSFNMGPVLSSLSSAGISALSYYLLDFEVYVPWGRILIILAVMLAISAAAVLLSLRRTRKIDPMRLFTNL